MSKRNAQRCHAERLCVLSRCRPVERVTVNQGPTKWQTRRQLCQRRQRGLQRRRRKTWKLNDKTNINSVQKCAMNAKL